MTGIFQFVMGPIIGGVIGYCTNYIAIRMLFRPKKAMYIGKFHIPFTPGIIPKRKNEIAKKLGEVVAANVFTKDDIASVFLSDGMKQAVGQNLTRVLYESEEPFSILAFLQDVMPEDESEKFMEQIDSIMSKKVEEAFAHTDIEGMVRRETQRILLEKTDHTPLAVFVTKERAAAIAQMIGKQLGDYTSYNGAKILMPILRQELANFMVTPTEDLLESVDVTREQQEHVFGQIYEHFIRAYSAEVVALFDIAGLTEKKIVEFEMEEIETLIHTTINHEMKAVVYFGGVLGAIIGLVNSLW